MASMKKRGNLWENEVMEENIDLPYSISFGDRFVPRRNKLVNSERNLKHTRQKPVNNILGEGVSQCYWGQNWFIPTMNYVLEMTNERVLQLMDPFKTYTDRKFCKNYKCLITIENDWPCKPRARPAAYQDTTFDLPDYDSSCDHNLVDWSCKDQIAVSFGRDVIIWKSIENLTMSFNVNCPRALAYSPNGDFLAIGCKPCEYPVLELWDVSSSMDFSVLTGKIFRIEEGQLQCIQWDKSGKFIVCGTYFGTMYVLKVPDMKTEKKIRKHTRPITIIRFSPTMRFLATGDSEGNIVIYNWALFTIHLKVKSHKKASIIFDWHPWTGVDLAIAEDVPASICLLHVPSKKIIAHYQQLSRKIVISSISFSKVTGELLVSIHNQEEGTCNDYKVLVLCSLDRIVDILRISDGGARFLMWSPDGSKVATTGNDETLTMWNFFSRKMSTGLKRLNGPKDKNSTESKFGHQFKKWNFIK